ncbi:MAG: hypothetical protein ACI9F9_001464 [Candidatus Paceibacteria bacterium]|jgi:hypothetical protein
MTSSTVGPRRILPLIVLWVVVAIELIAMLALNGGKLMYTLDDPYIHLALAEHILGGHFGLNGAEASSPASSILWPFLLAPFTALSMVEWVPLLLNILFASATLVGVQRSIGLALNGSASRFITLLTILAIPALNLVGLIFTGMEHSLQVLCAVYLVYWLLRAAGEGRSSKWLLFFIVLGPLVRYENAALSAAALAWLWLNGQRSRALLGAALVAMGLLAYSFFLRGLGLPFLPTSVMAKSASMAPEGGAKAMVYALYHNLESTPGVLMSLAILALAATATRRDRPVAEKHLALVMAGGLSLHLLVGRFGWYSRYELYAWSAGLLVVLYLWRDSIARVLSAQSMLKATLVCTVAVGIGCREYVIVLGNNALASHNVYLQHYQMHRFATEFLAEPVAVNDLGWVAFQNESYVLDLWGLGSLAALEARKGAEDSSWIQPLADQNNVRTAIVYDEWFDIMPAAWQRIGVLEMHVPRVTPAHSKVAFYAMNSDWALELTGRLRRFEATLPEGASFTFDADRSTQ